MIGEHPIVWLTIGDANTASSRVRAFVIADELAERGVRTTCLPATGIKGRWRALSAVAKSNPAPIVVVQKILYGPIMLRLLRWKACLLVWECDDALHLGQSSASQRNLRRTQRLIRQTLCQADVVTTSTPQLANELRPARGRSVAFRGPAPAEASCYGRRERLVVWLGSPSTEEYLELLQGAAERLRNRGWSLVAVGASEAVETLGWEAITWSPQAQKVWLGKALVGVMPQRRDPWSDRKQGYKLFEYMAHGVVPVASDVPAAQAVLSPVELSNLLVPVGGDWVRAIEGAAARRETYVDRFHRVLDRYSVAATVDAWVDAVGAGLT